MVKLIIVRDDGFHNDDLDGAKFVSSSEVAISVGEPIHLNLEANDEIDKLKPHFPQIKVIRVQFSSFENGTGFSLAFRLRQLGYRGRLRAEGHLIADQYPLARRSGFDEVAIFSDIAERQPAEQWPIERARKGLSYQSRLQKADDELN